MSTQTSKEKVAAAKKSGRRPMVWQKRVLCMAAGLALMAAAALGLYRVLPEETAIQEETLYSYEVFSDVTYEVALLPNDLFPEGRLPQGRVYASQLTDYISFDLTAVYQGTQEASLEGSAQVTAVLRAAQTGSDGSERLIYETRETLTSGRLERSDGSATLSATVDIRPEDYRQAASQVSEALGASPNFQFFLLFEGSFLADTPYGAVEAPFTCRATIPVGRDTALYEVTVATGEPVADSLTHMVETVTPGAGLQTIIPLAAVALLGLALLVFGGLLTRPPGLEERYQAQLGKVMRKYGDRMVRLDRLPETGTGDTVRVTDVNSLVLLAEELRQPILYEGGAQDAPGGRFCVRDGATVFLLELEPPSTTLVVEKDGTSDP